MLLLALMLSLTHADTIEVMGPIALTQHVLNDPEASSNFSNRLSKDGSLIANPQLGLIITHKDPGFYESKGLYIGQNSVGSPMAGVIAEYGRTYYKLQYGIATGAYLQDETEFDRRDITPYNFSRIGTIGIVPIFGFALNYSVPLTDKYYMKINNVISPIITNTTLSVGFKW